VRPVRLTLPAVVGRVLLVVALLASWQAALQHPIEHVDELGEFVHLHSGHSHEDGSSAEPLCDALAALTACAPDAVLPPVAAGQVEYSRSPQHQRAPRAADAPPFLSQGPPASA
jgi:hypothetical protein